MSDINESFFTSIGCMDGRVQFPVALYGQTKYQAQYPDTITEAGLVGLLSRLSSPEGEVNGGQANNPQSELLESIKKKVLISVEKHHSKGIIVHGHQECAGNPVEDSVHKQNVLKAAEAIRLIAPNLEVKPVFVVKENGNWKIQELE